MKYEPYPYQKYAEKFVLEHDAVGLLLDMGLGKTAITLSACEKLLRDYFSIGKVLVIAPLLPAKDTWPKELAKWDHLEGLTYSLIVGTAAQRIAALKRRADFYIVNRDMVTWLVDYYKKAWPFEMVVIDELSSFKSSKAQRFRSLKRVRKYIKRIVGLTGTPAPNGLMDLWAQMYLLDGGERLGRTLTSYREAYFNPGRRGPNGIIYDWVLKDGAEEAIYKKLEGLCISMKTEDHVTLPEKLFIRHDVALGKAALQQYQQLERDALLPFSDGDVDAGSAAILANKLLQMAGGAVYDENGGVKTIHEEKFEKMDQLFEEANGQPVLVFYNYKHELTRLKERYPQAIEIKEDGSIERWNAGEVPILLANPASAGHGLNLQFGGHIIIWFSPTWNLEYYEQANKRLHRKGQTETVLIHNLVAKGTIDERVLDVALARKKQCQDDLLIALKARIKEVFAE